MRDTMHWLVGLTPPYTQAKEFATLNQVIH